MRVQDREKYPGEILFNNPELGLFTLFFCYAMTLWYESVFARKGPQCKCRLLKNMPEGVLVIFLLPSNAAKSLDTSFVEEMV